jgi:hypothetical protein
MFVYKLNRRTRICPWNVGQKLSDCLASRRPDFPFCGGVDEGEVKMAAVPVTISGMYTNDDGTSGNVTIVGLASITGLGVGGGPVIPGAPPPNFPNVPPHPAFPIAGPGPFPPGAGYPPVVGGGPIYPTDPEVPPPTDTSKIEWHAAWTAADGWVTVGIIKPEGPVPTPSA